MMQTSQGLTKLYARFGQVTVHSHHTQQEAVRTLAALPDGLPAIDDPALVHLMRQRGEETGSLTILPYAAVTTGCRGEAMAELGLLREAGAVAFTDGADGLRSARLMRMALSCARGFGDRIVRTRRSRRSAAAQKRKARWRTGSACPPLPPPRKRSRSARHQPGRTHRRRSAFAHVATAAALALIRRAKEDGVAVTCDTAPPYFDLNETAIGDFRTYAKLRPRCARTAIARQSRRAGGRHDRRGGIRSPAA